jgi:hypothetical protein
MNVRPTAAVRIVGNQPVALGDASLYPSDHFGLAATVELIRAEAE